MLKHEMGKRLEKVREGRGMTREEVAEKAGISTKFLYEVERGKKGISAQTLLRLSKTLSVSCDYLLVGEETMVVQSSGNDNNKKQFNRRQKELVEEIVRLIYEINENK